MLVRHTFNITLTIDSDDDEFQQDEAHVRMAVEGVLYSERTWDGEYLSYVDAMVTGAHVSADPKNPGETS